MTTKEKIFTILAFVVAAFFILEVILSIAIGNIGAPILVKLIIAAICIFYGFKQIKRKKSELHNE